MQCDDVGPLLLRRLDGRLAAADDDRVAQHLAQCGSCRDELASQAVVAEILASRPTTEAPRDFASRVMAELDPAPGWLEMLNWRVWTYRLAPVAAALVLVAALGFGPTEAAEPLEFTDLVEDWVADEDSGALPSISVLWLEEAGDDILLEAVLTATAGE
jgi:predicted anti-sigma-YlaC factor YlaD